jgi:ubiquitin-protein ligase
LCVLQKVAGGIYTLMMSPDMGHPINETVGHLYNTDPAGYYHLVREAVERVGIPIGAETTTGGGETA